MAKIKLSPMLSSLSGTIGDMTFRTMHGQTYMFQKAAPKLPENATRKQKAKYKKQVMVNQCVQILQGEIEDILEAINKRPAIKKKVEYWYDKFAPHIKAKTKLQMAIMRACRQSIATADDPVVIKATDASALAPHSSRALWGPHMEHPEIGSRMERDFLDNGSMKSEKELKGEK